jgi:preprotein translocase subunit SecG
MTIAYYTLLALLIFISVLLVLLILIQKGRGGGLSGAFGGSGSGSAAFGAKTGDVLTWATSTVFGLFILLAVILDLVVNSQFKSPVAPATVAGGVPPVVPMTSTVPDTTPPPAAPAPVTTAPVTTPMVDLKNALQSAATQAVHDVKSTTQR